MLWARVNKSTGYKQTLLSHVNAVNNSCGMLCAKVNLENTGRIIGLLHDLGKASPEWQDWIISLTEDTYNEKGPNHSSAGAILIKELLDIDSSNSLAAQMLELVILGHHGGLPDILTAFGETPFDTRIKNKTNEMIKAQSSYTKEIYDINTIKEMVRSSVKELNNLIRKILLISTDNGERKFLIGMSVRFLLSVLVDSDRWNAANSESGYTEEDIVDNSLLWHDYRLKLEDKLNNLHKSDELSTLRKMLSDNCSVKLESGQIYRVSAPTGSGKTFASIRFALNNIKDNGQIFYIAPFKTILEQNAAEVRNVLGENSVFEHHSDIVQRNEAYDLYAERYNFPIIFTTMVQFLDTLFDGSNSCTRRFHRLANSIILIDEIQSVPLQCTYMLNIALRFLTEICGSTVLLVTATQPPLDKLKQHSIPIYKDLSPDISGKFQALRNIELENKIAEHEYTVSSLAELIAGRVETDKSILIIVNTKQCAIDLYDAVKNIIGDNCDLTLLTSLMCPEHRRDIIKCLKCKLELTYKSVAKVKTVICISTQLIEAGVDISFETVIRSMAGVDSLLQAAGRCNRSNEYGHGTLILVKMMSENLTKLKYILSQQNAMKKTFLQNDGNIISDTAIRTYYNNLYNDTEKELGFPVSTEGKNVYLYDLLSINNSGLKVLYERGQKSYYILNQAFDTAGKLFHVIEPGGTTVVVPYNNEAKTVIATLMSNTTVLEKKMLLRKAQSYCVELRKYQIEALKQYITMVSDIGVFILDGMAYSKETGVMLRTLTGEGIFVES
jgi:CRISPR-associated endonuclease/helicase Cas3